MELVLELRDLVHDHLGTRGMLHDLRPGVEQRRSDRDLMGLADHLPPDPHGRGLDVGARVGVPDRGWPVLVGRQARRAGLVLVHRLVQRDRPARRCGVGGLRGGDLRLDSLQPLGTRPGGDQLRGRRSARRGVRRLRRAPDPARVDQHLLVAPGRAVQQHLGVLARRRRRGDHRDPDHRPGPPPERRLRLHGDVQQLRVRRRLHHEPVLLGLRAAGRLPPDDVHGHGVRRLRARVRGDEGGRDGCGEGDLAVRLLLGDHRLVRAAGDHVRGG